MWEPMQEMAEEGVLNQGVGLQCLHCSYTTNKLNINTITKPTDFKLTLII